MSVVACPRKLYKAEGLNRPLDLSLTTEDIDGAQAKKKGFVTKRCVDPLDPAYKLPSFQPPPIPDYPNPIGLIPTNYTADITGARVRKAPGHREGPKGGLDISDIEFAQPHFRLKARSAGGKSNHDSLNVSDINKSDMLIPRRRETNPLQPMYRISTVNMWSPEMTDSEPLMVGPIEGANPRRLIPEVTRPTKGDITGTHPQRFVGRLPHSSVDKTSIQPWEKPLPTASRASSLKRGIVTKRSTNPLDPNYLMLNGQYDSASSLFM
jgi:hypothetical protein